MIAVAIVCAAAFAQAGQVNWSSGYLNLIGQAGEEADFVDGGMVYLLSGDASAFVTAAADKGFASALAAATIFASATLSEDALTSPASTLYPVTGNGTSINIGNADSPVAAGSYTLFMVMDDAANNAFYVSEELTKSVPGSGGQPFSFDHDGAFEGNVFNAADGYVTGGYYQTEIIPEPTSGLLLLLGVAGLALRRRRT